MLHTPSFTRLRSTACISLLFGAAFLAGCAQQTPAGYYDRPHESTLTDAHQHAQGGRGSRAPSQLQFGFGETEAERAAAARAAQQAQQAQAADTDTSAADVATSAEGTVRPLLEAKTFLGTVPCVSGDANCPPMRITLTLAPSGEWRSRTVPVNASGTGTPLFQQGCWDVMGTHPLRIVMQAQNEESKTSLSFVNDNVLRIMMFNDIRPILDFHLTRQADIDPIDELADQPALSCD